MYRWLAATPLASSPFGKFSSRRSGLLAGLWLQADLDEKLRVCAALRPCPDSLVPVLDAYGAQARRRDSQEDPDQVADPLEVFSVRHLDHVSLGSDVRGVDHVVVLQAAHAVPQRSVHGFKPSNAGRVACVVNEATAGQRVGRGKGDLASGIVLEGFV